MMQGLRCLTLLLCTAGCTFVWGQDHLCSSAIGSVADEIAFLKEQNDSRQSPCITIVIKQLGRAHAGDAVPTLVEYLDFISPATAPRPDGFADRRPQCPAMDALFQIGKPATAAIISVAQASESSTTRSNASKTYLSIYRDDLALGIHILRLQESVAISTDGRSRLQELLDMLINDCSQRREQEAQACREAAKDH